MDLPIGELAKLTRVKVPTIRFYEQIGLLKQPLRTEGNQRRYGPSDVARLNFIRNARELGFEVDAIHELLAISVNLNEPCRKVDDIAREHLAAVDRRIKQLKSLRRELERMIEACSHNKICNCKIMEALADQAAA